MSSRLNRGAIMSATGVDHVKPGKTICGDETFDWITMEPSVQQYPVQCLPSCGQRRTCSVLAQLVNLARAAVSMRALMPCPMPGSISNVTLAPSAWSCFAALRLLSTDMTWSASP